MSDLAIELRALGDTAALCTHAQAAIPTVSGVGLTLFAMPARRLVLGASGRLRTQQATGMVMSQATADAVTALHQLRTHAFYRNLPLATVVDQVLAGSLRFDPDTTP